MTLNQYTNLKEAADFCGLSIVTLWRHCKSGAIPSEVKFARRLILKAHLADWIAAGGIKKRGNPRKRKPEVFETTVPGHKGFNIDVVLEKAEPIEIQLQN